MPPWLRTTLYIVFLLLIIGLSYFIIRDFTTIVPNYTEITKVYGLKHLSEDDIQSELSKLQLSNKSFLENNALKISKQLEKNPLIKKAKVRHFKYPTLKSKIYIEEAKLWAYYGMLIIDDEAKVVITLDDKSLSQETLEDIYIIQTNLVRIESVALISNQELQTLRQVTSIIEGSLQKAGLESHVKKIKGDIENNYIFFTDKYIFKVGLLDDDLFNRVKRMNHVASKIPELEDNGTKLEYFDLSLTTSDVIIGKKN